ncbi:MAG: hypothetical protein IJK27_02085 [Bacilli bacterium]|nr:hypothetical protein [Bacilli bacterium]
MKEIDLVLHYSELLSLYSNLLSETQKEILEDYYLANLSVSEIAENRNISRAAVEDAIKKGKMKLDDYESKLGSLNTVEKIREIKSKVKDKEFISYLNEVERSLKHGI